MHCNSEFVHSSARNLVIHEIWRSKAKFPYAQATVPPSASAFVLQSWGRHGSHLAHLLPLPLMLELEVKNLTKAARRMSQDLVTNIQTNAANLRDLVILAKESAAQT